MVDAGVSSKVLLSAGRMINTSFPVRCSVMTRTSASHLAVFIVSLFLLLPLLGIATSGVNDSPEELESLSEVSYTHSSSSMNEAGFQHGSIFTDNTLVSGSAHNCAIVDGGNVSCWGNNNDGRLGNGATSAIQNTPTPTSTLGLGKYAVEIASGWDHTCVILNDGTVSCWGKGSNHRLGNGNLSNQLTPTPTSSLGVGRTAIEISTGSLHTCVILDNGSVSCWGDGLNGNLGNGAFADAPYPTPTNSLGVGRSAVAITSGAYHTCVILDNGSVSCWGDDTYGQLGTGQMTYDGGGGHTSPNYNFSNSPVLTNSLGEGRTAVAISAGLYHTCAILDNGSISCWGKNHNGELGYGNTSTTDTPMLASFDGKAISISSNYDANCAILENYSIACWGEGWSGQLGNGGTSRELSPQIAFANVSEPFGTDRFPVAISKGTSHTCVVLDNGNFSCWGDSHQGKLGNNVSDSNGNPIGGPDQYSPTTNRNVNDKSIHLSERDRDNDTVIDIFDTHMAGGQEGSIYMDATLAMGWAHECALLVSGSVICWGDGDNGKLGHGLTTDSENPVNVSLPSGMTATAISAGRYHTCAIMDNGSLMCWGQGTDGQIGDGTGTHRSIPSYVSLPSGLTVEAVTGGRWHTCAILDDGSVWCWGHNNQGQLGDGTYTSRATPVNSALPSGRTAVSIAAGYTHTCAILDDGSVRCWGGNSYGQRGIGSSGGSSNSPASSGSITQIPSGMSAVAIAIDDAHTCAILNDGSVWCWGYNMEGQIGNGYSGSTLWNVLTPTQINLPSGRTADLITVGNRHTCVVLAPNLTDNGRTMCWGVNNPNNSGMVSSGGIDFTPSNTPVFANVTDNVVSLRAGNQKTCYILSNSSIRCVGLESSDPGHSNAHVNLSLQVSAPEMGVMDKDGDGIIDLFDDFLNNPIRGYSCPGGSYGRYVCEDASVGYYVDTTASITQTACTVGTYQPSTGQTSCIDSSPGYYVDSIASTTQTACAVGTYQPSAGQTSCIDASAGNYVDSTAQSSQIACSPGTYNNVTGSTSSSDCLDASVGYYAANNSYFGINYDSQKIATGTMHTCVILDDGSVSCWGAGDNGKLGNGQTDNEATPTQTASLGVGRTAVAISAGQFHTCALLDNGSVSCWGYNGNGRLGDGTQNTRLFPTLTSSFGVGKTAIAISAGWSHTCAILDDGNVSCWGKNVQGQLGDGTQTNRFIPTQTSSLGEGRTAIAISAGSYHTCALLDDGSVSCWGDNSMGQIGDGDSDQGQANYIQRHNPTPISSPGNNRTIVAIDAGQYYTCAILDDGSVSCWGSNDDGQLGDGTQTDRNVTTPTSSLGVNRTAVGITSGSLQTCAILDDGSVSCWGANNYGQLGDGTTIKRLIPTPTSSLGINRTAVAIASGGDHTCAILDNGSVSCWGKGGNAQLGDGTENDKLTPTQTSSLGNGSTAAIATIFYEHTGQTSQTPCSVGTYQPSTGQSSCIDASAGYYVDTTASTTQTACPTGTYNSNNASTSSSDCTDASAGYHVPNAGSATQTPCPTGTYQPSTGQSSCIDSSAGYYVGSTGSSSQTPCPVGTYQPSTGQSSCIDASAGHYVDTTASTTQTPCSTGTYQPSTSQSSCIDSSAGYYVDNTGSTNQTACDLGTFQNQTGQDSCTDASPGYYVDTTASTTQTACALGTYQPSSGQSSCINSSAGYYVGSTGSASQTPCIAGTYQPSTGQSSCIDADPGYFVPISGSANQTACSHGNYQPSSGQSSCIDASPGNYVDTNASIVQNPCIPGTYQPSSGQSSCLDSDAGHYVPNSGSVVQLPCHVGTFQELTGQVSCVDASAGYYVNTTASTIQIACPLGSYQPLTGQTSCLLATPGHYVPLNGSSTQTPCLAGTYNPLNGSFSQGDCIQASTGHHVPNEGSASQIECLVGYFQNITGQSSCNPADPGYFVPNNASWFQVGCTYGTYQPNSGQASCLDASPGHYVPGFASSTQTECALGSYQPQSGETSCISASVGYYVDQPASTNQTSCPPGTSTNSTGSVSINDCYTDTDFDGIPDILDPDDDNDGYLDDLDVFPLDPNEWIDTDSDGIGNNADLDDDNDGWSDLTEIDCGDSDPLNGTSTPADYDEDGICNTLDDDDDNDSYEDSNDDFPFDECAFLDTDGDGMPDWLFLNCNTNLSEDIDDDNDGYNDTNDSHPLDPTEWFDKDNDGIGNNADTDDDGDNVPDQFDAFPLDPTEWTDTDGDGVGDNADTDNDNDGVLDTNDDFPNDANETTDTDGDGIGNNADDDDDGDGYLDIYDQFPLDSTEWVDTDLDGIGNNADPDDDGDGWTDNDELICGSDELDANDVPDDSDGDGICDSEEDDNTGLGVIVDVISNPLVVGLFLLMGAIIIVTLFVQSRNQSSKINELERMIGDSTIIEDDEQFND